MKNLLFPAALLFCTLLRAQAVEDVVAAGCGGGITTDGIQYDWLLGELMVELYADGISLDQGFGPAPCFTVSTHQTSPGPQIALAAYPNPTTGQLNLECYQIDDYHVVLYDLQGRTLLNETTHTGKLGLQLQPLPSGTYILAAFSDGALIKSFTIQKIQ